MPTPQMVGNDLQMLQSLAEMAQTLHDVAMAESELTGHSIPTASALVFTAQQATLISETINKVTEAMLGQVQLKLKLQ